VAEKRLSVSKLLASMYAEEQRGSEYYALSLKVFSPITEYYYDLSTLHFSPYFADSNY